MYFASSDANQIGYAGALADLMSKTNQIGLSAAWNDTTKAKLGNATQEAARR